MEFLTKFHLGIQIIDVDGNRTKMIGSFNNQPFHFPPIVLNFLTNSLLHHFGVKTLISVRNSPYDYTALDHSMVDNNLMSYAFLLGLAVGMGIPFFTGLSLHTINRKIWRRCNRKMGTLLNFEMFLI